MTPASRSGALAAQARFVFQGTVKNVRATTLKSVPASPRTVVVRVDRVIQSPETLSDYAGHDITVQLAPGERVRQGQALIFHTTGWIFGDGLAVRSLGHEEATTPRMAAAAAYPEDPVRSLQAREAMTQASRADLIVTGRVSSVRVPAAEAQARARGVASGSTTERISEHAPMWQEAVIDVDETHKGSERRKQVVVRFPSSTDVRWYHAPKFQAGQEGVFLLHKQQIPATTARAASFATLKAPEYTALHPSDFQPLERLPQIQLVASAPAARPKPPATAARRARSKPRRRSKGGR
jgi:hypothetical protein